MSSNLDRQVAELLGYHAKCIGINAYSNRETWYLMCPDGKPCHDQQAFTEEEAWEQHVPRYSTDLNLAMSLVSGSRLEHLFMLRQFENAWLAAITDETLQRAQGSFEGRSEIPAKAICLAWLEWHSNQ